jgi:hypothetical protein
MIANVMRQNLRKIVSAYRAATGKTVAQVSKKFYGNAGFLEAFFAGEQSISLNKLDAFLASITAKWPEGAEWPYCGAILIAAPRRKRK